MNPLKLLKDSLTYSLPIYTLLLILNLPNFLLTNFLIFDLSTWLKFPLLVFAIYLVNIFLFLWIWAASIYYIYYYLLKSRVGILRAFKATFKKNGQLVLGGLMASGLYLLGFILFIIPGIYMFVKTNFFPEAIVLENCTAKQGMNRSSALVRGYWWSVFLAIVVNFLVFGYLAVYLSSQIIIKLFPNIESAHAEMIGSILGLLLTPFSEVYNVLLFIRLRNLSSAS